VLEDLLSPESAARSPLRVFVVSFFLTWVAIVVSLSLFPDHASVLVCAILAAFLAPFFFSLFASEGAKESQTNGRNILSRHSSVIEIYGAFFLGSILAFSLAYVAFPKDLRAMTFAKQTEEIARLSTFLTGSAIRSDLARLIFANNTLVLLTTFLLSFLFGAGAALILGWNASVIATYAGLYATSLAAKGYPELAAYAVGIPQALLSISMHGIPEIFGYFFAGLAGGILSAGLASNKQFRKILVDALIFLGVGEFSIFVGAFIESGSGIFALIAFIAYLVFVSVFVFSPTIEKQTGEFKL